MDLSTWRSWVRVVLIVRVSLGILDMRGAAPAAGEESLLSCVGPSNVVDREKLGRV